MNPEDNQTNNQTDNSAENNMHKDPVMDFTKGNNGTVMGVLAYLGPLVLIPYLMEKKDEFVKFHTRQGMVLFGIEVIIMILSNTMNFWMFGNLLNLATLVLAIIGIVNVIQGSRKELPVVGGLAKSIKI